MSPSQMFLILIIGIFQQMLLRNISEEQSKHLNPGQQIISRIWIIKIPLLPRIRTRTLHLPIPFPCTRNLCGPHPLRNLVRNPTLWNYARSRWKLCSKALRYPYNWTCTWKCQTITLISILQKPRPFKTMPTISIKISRNFKTYLTRW